MLLLNFPGRRNFISAVSCMILTCPVTYTRQYVTGQVSTSCDLGSYYTISVSWTNIKSGTTNGGMSPPSKGQSANSASARTAINQRINPQTKNTRRHHQRLLPSTLYQFIFPHQLRLLRAQLFGIPIADLFTRIKSNY